VTCGNGTKFRTRKCIKECKNKSIETEYEPCNMGCCPGNYVAMKFYVVATYMVTQYGTN